MKKKTIHRRSYGYGEEDPGRGKNGERDAWEGDLWQAPKGRHIHQQKPIDWVGILLFPLKIVGWILSTLWHVIQARPRLRQATRQRLTRRTLRLAMIGGVWFLLFAAVSIAWMSRGLPDPDKLTDRQVSQSTKIYDRTGEHLLFEIFTDKKRTLITLDRIPKHVIEGVIATEDTTFYEHRGIRPLSILRAIVVGTFTNKRIGATSTLTQQLVKNAILSPERKITRKIKEVILSIRLEQKYTKDQILQIYFNEIPYGSTNYGIETASQNYFGKPASDLNLQESATLAGLPKAPSYYLRNKDALKQRRDFVLSRMYEEGYIAKEEKEAAQNELVTLEQKISNISAPHFVLSVKEQLVEKYGEQTVDTGGLKVITTLDWEKQEAAEKVMNDTGTKALAEAEADNAALVAIDPKTGHILAMIGSKDFNDDEIDGKFNVAALGRRQPGSSFKPIVYAAAFEKGYTPDTILFDVLTNFAVSGKPYEPKNYTLQEYGPVTMRQALQGSLNIPAVQTLYLVGDKKGIEFAKRLGYSTFDNGDFGLSLVLGGGEVSLVEHTSAFGVFANNGLRHAPISILRIEDADGEALEEWKQEKGEPALDPAVAATISNVLSDNASRAYIFGAGSALTLPGRPVAAKTGTTDNFVDAWTVGYTPSLAAGIWAGNTDNTPMKKGFGGSKVSGLIWNAFMKEALKNTPAESFPQLPPNTATKPVLRGSTGGGITLLVDKVTGKIATSSTPEQYIEEKTYIQPHSILHYVAKDDPRGPAPEHPNDDPQYAIWETAIQNWIKRKKEKDPAWNLSFEDPPTEFDDAHSLALIPTLEVVFPTEGAILPSRQIDTDIRVSAPRGVTKVTYQIDEAFVGVIRDHPFNLNYPAETLAPGAHIMTIAVEDDVGNRLEKKIAFILNVAEAAPGVSWVEQKKIVSASSYPLTLFLSPFSLENIKTITISAKKDQTKITLETIATNSGTLFNNQIPIVWKTAPEKGAWIVTADVLLDTGESGAGGSMDVVVE